MPTCLVVDDSKVIRKVARHILETLDFAVEEAGDGQDALDQCLASMPDVVLLDWNMPVMSGMEFLRALGEAAPPRRPKVVFCTTENGTAHIRAAIEAGADEYVMKPFDRETLESKLQIVGVAYMAPSPAARAVPEAPRRGSAPIRVLIVDDSIVARAVIARMIAADPDLEVVAQAGSGRAALAALGACPVDVIILDLEMPDGGGLESLPALIAAGGDARVLIVSSAAAAGAEATVTALRLGAADTLLKPAVGFGNAFAAALLDRLRRLARERGAVAPILPTAASPTPAAATRADDAPGCVAIGASTGGVHALAAFFGAYPRTLTVPILITQHLPDPFMTHFARQLAQMAGRPVAVAGDGAPVRDGTILLAPGDASITLLRTRGVVHVKLERRRSASGCLPSADPMFAAVGRIYGATAVAVVLSGMGRDGLIGATALRAAGGEVLAQDAGSSVIWGMPGAVAQAGLAAAVMPPAALAQRIAALAGRRERR